MKPRLITNRDPKDERFRCSCGATTGLEVIRTEHDEDNQVLRIRRCRNCDEVFATEERVIRLDTFYPRANSHAMRAKRADRRRFRRCLHCAPIYGQNNRRTLYRGGTYSMHVQKAYHIATLSTTPNAKERQRARRRAYVNYWKARGIDILSTLDYLPRGEREEATA